MRITRCVLLLVLGVAGVGAVGLVAVGSWEGLLLLAQALLAGVFLVAALAKLGDRRSFSEAISGFGAPAALAPALAILLPLVELCVAVALLIPASAAAGALGALALLFVFSLAAAVALARGRTVDCNCFGRVRPAPLSATTLLRNGLLGGLAATVVLAGPGDPALGENVAPVVAAVVVGLAVLVAIGIRGGREEPGELTVIEAGLAPALDTSGSSGSAAALPALTRRRSLRLAASATLGAGLFSGLGWPGPSHAARPSCKCTNCKCCGPSSSPCEVRCCEVCACGGFAGGGLVQTATGSAHMAAFGTRLTGRGRDTILGGLTWSDPGWQGSGLRLESARVTFYGRRPDSEVRVLRGFASANGSGSYRFALEIVDAGAGGSGADIVNLTVRGLAASGAGGTGSEYAATGRLVSGDLTLKALASGGTRPRLRR